MKERIFDYAERELRAAGFLDEDSDYGGALGPAVMRAVRAWVEEGHSGASHNVALFLFTRVINRKPLAPLTSDPAEWNEVDSGLWQSKRDAEAFSEDGGATYYLLSEKHGTYGCRDCGVGFETARHPIVLDPDDVCSCGKPYVVLREGQPHLRHKTAPRREKP